MDCRYSNCPALRARSGPFEGPARVKPPALPGDTYSVTGYLFSDSVPLWRLGRHALPTEGMAHGSKDCATERKYEMEHEESREPSAFVLWKGEPTKATGRGKR